MPQRTAVKRVGELVESEVALKLYFSPFLEVVIRVGELVESEVALKRRFGPLPPMFAALLES